MEYIYDKCGENSINKEKVDINSNIWRCNFIMKRFFTYLLLICVVLMNIYLIFYWHPVDSTYIEDDISAEVTSYSKSLYKINKKNVLYKLEDKEKQELEVIIYKLSAFDIGKIESYIEDSDEDRGAINMFKLLKKRLSSEDYNRIREICVIFLDIDELEKQM